MGVFDDKKFEQLDWVSQITETIESDLNGLLARLPEKYDLTFELINSLIKSSYDRTLSIDKIINHLLTQSNLKLPDNPDGLYECFKFEISKDLVLDLENGTLQGHATLIKKTQTIEDETLQKMMGKEGIQAVQYSLRSLDNSNIGRINEIIDLIGGLEQERSHRSVRKKIYAISKRLESIFANNEWRIRDMALANRICYWIKEYMVTGNLAAYTNFCKIKVMTHSNMPIYSIEEEEF